MSKLSLDDLAEAARNRGLKLVRSRVRTPTRRRFGKVGLADKSDKAVFGIDTKGPAETPDAVEEFLRNLGAQDWGASLDQPVQPRKTRAKSDRAPAPKRARPRPAKPKPEPKLELRAARPGDAAALASLIRLLDHKVDEKGVRKRVAALARDKLAPLVATLDKQVVGLCGIHRMTAVHRDQPVGRVTILVVAEQARGRGIGRKLLHEAEAQLRASGCRLIEVTSNDRLSQAHAFYRHMGYERTSIRFAKSP